MCAFELSAGPGAIPAALRLLTHRRVRRLCSRELSFWRTMHCDPVPAVHMCEQRLMRSLSSAICIRASATKRRWSPGTEGFASDKVGTLRPTIVQSCLATACVPQRSKGWPRCPVCWLRVLQIILWVWNLGSEIRIYCSGGAGPLQPSIHVSSGNLRCCSKWFQMKCDFKLLQNAEDVKSWPARYLREAMENCLKRAGKE